MCVPIRSVITLHGNPRWGFLYHYFIPPFLEAGYRTIAFDKARRFLQEDRGPDIPRAAIEFLNRKVGAKL